MVDRISADSPSYRTVRCLPKLLRESPPVRWFFRIDLLRRPTHFRCSSNRSPRLVRIVWVSTTATPFSSTGPTCLEFRQGITCGKSNRVLSAGTVWQVLRQFNDGWPEVSDFRDAVGFVTRNTRVRIERFRKTENPTLRYYL